MHLCDLHTNGRALYAWCTKRSIAALYYYDTDILRARLRTMLAILPHNVRLLYSLKANPTPPLISVIAHEGCGADVSSGVELTSARRCGFSPDKICFVGPGKSAAELQLALQHQIGTIAVESVSEIHTLRQIAAQQRCRASAIVRINPTYEVRGVRMAMGGRVTQFGLEQGEALQLMRMHCATQDPLHICGLHTYVGTRISSAGHAAWNAGQVLAQARQFGEAGAPCTKIDLGGGFGIPYYEGEEELCFDAFVEALQQHIRAYEATSLPPCILYLESGRYIVGPAGCFCVRVKEASHEEDLQHVEIDASPALHGLSSGSFLAKHRLFLGAGLHQQGWECGNRPTNVWYRLHGERRQWPVRILAPSLRPKDYLVFLNSGAYGPTISAVWDHLEGYPAECVGAQGQMQMCRPPMTWQTLVESQRMSLPHA